MGKSAKLSANEIIEEQLDEHLDGIEKETKSDVLVFLGPLHFNADSVIRDAVEFIKNKRPKLTFVLETQGGYIEVAQRIADTLRKHYSVVNFLIPNYAMSAGTVLVMSGDAIYMDYYSILGPIDPQVEGPNKRFIPAAGYLVQYDRLIEKSRLKTITTAELQFLLEKFDPAELYRFEQEMELSVSLLEEWLVKYKFKNWTATETRGKTVTPKMRRQRAKQIAEDLQSTEKWHSHSRGISMEVLRRDVKLQIEDFSENAVLTEAIRCYYKLLNDYRGKTGIEVVVHAKGFYLGLK